MIVQVAWQRTLIEPPLNGHCWRCGRRRNVVAGYYVGGGRGQAPWRPVCRPCDMACLSDPDGDQFLAGLQFVRPDGVEYVGLPHRADGVDPEGR
jgi:hypothetical protein